VRRGVFGGSFDPVHQGHLKVAASAADQLALDVVHFVPARQQPFKVGAHRASSADRAAMLERALTSDARFVLDRREVEREGPSYTVDTLGSLRAEFPGDRLFFLVGADAARELPQWHEAERLPELAEIVVLTRPGADPPGSALIDRVLVVPAAEVSATAVRERVRRGESIAGMVPDAVAEYIDGHGLYK
jgi:nicotinate-nucleotide adenylyltransferase